MKSLSKLGLAAVLVFGVSGVAISQDAGAGADPAAPAAGAEVGVDPLTTGSISSQTNLATSIQSASDFDLSAVNDQSTVNCVKVSQLEAGTDPMAIGSAASSNEAISTLRTDIQANTDLMTKLESSCAVAEFDVQDIVYFETAADGSLVFYYDDSAA